MTMPRLKHFARLQYGDALPAVARREGDTSVYGSGGPGGWHDTPNTGGPTIVVGRKGSFGSIHWSAAPVFCIDTAYFVDADHTSCDLRYLFYLLHVLGLDSLSQDVGVPGLSRAAAHNTPLPVPPPPHDVQRRIANYLDRECSALDALHNEYEEQELLAEERCAAELARVFTPGAGRKVVRVQHLLSRRPTYGVLVPQYVDVADGVPFVRVNDIPYLSDPNRISRHIAAEQSREYARTVLQGGEVVLGVVGKMGQAAAVPEHLSGANVARAVAVLRPDQETPSELLSSWIRSSHFLRQAEMATGGDSVQPTLGMADLAKFTVAWPDGSQNRAEALRQVTEIAAWQNEMRRALQRQRVLLAERRRALITAAVTGQLDITGEAA